MRCCKMPEAMWLLFGRSFRMHLISVFGYDRKSAAEIAGKAKTRYKEIIERLPEFDRKDIYQKNAVNASMLAAFVLSMPERPSLEALTRYYAESMMTSSMKWFCRKSGKSRFTEKDIEKLKAAEALRAADNNPYSWNLDFYEYEDGYEARFTKCGICRIMKDYGLYDLTPALCHLDYTMNDAYGTSIFEREYTLASGGPYCDCRYKKIMQIVEF